MTIKMTCKCLFEDKELIKAEGFYWDYYEKLWWKNVNSLYEYFQESNKIKGFTWDLKKEKI